VYNNREDIVKNELTLGTYFFVIFDVRLYISGSKFHEGLAMEGGAIFISGDCSVTIMGSEFLNNYAKIYGGAIYGSGFNKLLIGGGT
jgi:predicted outer membrane repeat protein